LQLTLAVALSAVVCGTVGLNTLNVPRILDCDCLGVFVLSVVFLGVDLFMLFQVLGSLE
jgi:hypothetical protein